jgi:hypothetical protein
VIDMAKSSLEIELQVTPTVDLQTAKLALSAVNLYLHQNTDKCLITHTNDDGTTDYVFENI